MFSYIESRCLSGIGFFGNVQNSAQWITLGDGKASSQLAPTDLAFAVAFVDTTDAPLVDTRLGILPADIY